MIKVCSNCVMDTTDSSLRFDENGICDHCNTYYSEIEPNWDTSEIGQAKMQAIANKIKKNSSNKDFDCIIGMSGGIDSSYLVYLAKEKLNLRPLVFHVDAGWNSQQAVNNIENIVDKLGLDLYTEVINWEEMKDLQLAYIKSGVPTIDTPQDHSFFATMYKFAAKHNIKTILTGGNYSTECIRNPVEWMYFQSDSTQIKDIYKKFGKKKKLEKFPLTNILWHKFYLPLFRNIKLYRPLDYFPYNKKDATNFLISRFDYQPYSQKHFESRFTKFYESYWLPMKFGYDTRKVQYSSLILTGQMSREEALKKLQKPAYNEEELNNDIEFVANKLDISVNELMEYFYQENKSYKDYKNQHYLYGFGARIFKMLGLEKGGKR